MARAKSTGDDESRKAVSTFLLPPSFHFRLPDSPGIGFFPSRLSWFAKRLLGSQPRVHTNPACISQTRLSPNQPWHDPRNTGEPASRKPQAASLNVQATDQYALACWGNPM